jgi:predicted nucleotidyltransferase
MRTPTGVPALDALLADFVDEVDEILAADFVGAYLQGSFALGEGDEHSDVDFVVVTAADPTDHVVDRLQRMHERLFAREVAWAQHLEGSYIPRDRLRRVDPTRALFVFLDNGTDRLVRDAHCNTAVVRWLLREHGIVLAGPSPAELIDPVSFADLRREGIETMHRYDAWARSADDPGPMSAWKQPYLVLTACRILYTIEFGAVASKRRSADWAMASLDPEWTGLIRAAVEGRADPWGRVHLPASPSAAKRTLDFLAYATDRADRA